MPATMRVLIEEPPKGKRWVAIAGDWPGLERNGKSEEDAVAKLQSYIPRYLRIAGDWQDHVLYQLLNE